MAFAAFPTTHFGAHPPSARPGAVGTTSVIARARLPACPTPHRATPRARPSPQPKTPSPSHLRHLLCAQRGMSHMLTSATPTTLPEAAVDEPQLLARNGSNFVMKGPLLCEQEERAAAAAPAEELYSLFKSFVTVRTESLISGPCFFPLGPRETRCVLRRRRRAYPLTLCHRRSYRSSATRRRRGTGRGSWRCSRAIRRAVASEQPTSLRSPASAVGFPPKLVV